MLIVVSGASGAGKSAILPHLRARLSGMSWHEFDSVGVPPDADTAWRQRTLEHWVRHALAREREGIALGLCGQVAYGEVLACPVTARLTGVAVCHLDCADVTRIDRLRECGRAVDQDTLSWAAWLRVHGVDPTWRPDVITAGGLTDYAWERWRDWERGDPRWQIHQVDTTDRSVAQVADHVAAWIERQLQQPRNPVAD